MTPRVSALVFGLLGTGLTLAQFALPGRDWYHSWQYAAVLAIVLAVVSAYAWRARAGSDGPRGVRLAYAACGAFAVAAAGLVAGLIGPDTVTVFGAPGGVTPVPDVEAAAFFGAADADGVRRGDAVLTLRRRGAPPLEVGLLPVTLGLSVLSREERPAAYVVARDGRGGRLTVTQPTNATFLSPVLVFRGTQAIGGKNYPFDTFAVPAAHRVVRALYFSGADLAALRHGLPDGEGGIVLSVADDAGAALGVTIAPSGREVAVAGVRLTIVMGTYPVLVVASAPQPFVVLAGLVVSVACAIWAASPVPPGLARPGELPATASA